VRRLRPFRRRAARIARPARVRIRSRNPCVFARRRVFGWYVRFPLAIVGTSSHETKAGCPPAEGGSIRKHRWVGGLTTESPSRRANAVAACETRVLESGPRFARG
jgi:hypothetical protein